MGELILCCGRIAAMPYYIEQASLNIYSVEELCYYMEQYPDRLDDSFFDAELERWIAQELKLPELAQELEEGREQKSRVAEQVEKVFRVSGYLTRKEASAILVQLRELENKDEFERGRLRADRYVKNHRYAAGIMEYRRLLGIAQQTGKEASCIGEIWHNMGVACANMFLYEQAALCMEKAYEYNNQQESLVEMYLARQCISEESSALESTIPEEWEPLVTQRLRLAEEETEEEPEERMPEEQLLEWKKNYRLYSRL